jgi:glucose/arabinose dehydrogenase
MFAFLRTGVNAELNITFPPTAQAGDPEETPTLVPILQREVAEGLYKIWPKAPLPPGEYAVVEFTPGKLNMQIWDFAVKAK